MFILPFKFISTDLVINEIEYPDGAELVVELKSKGLDEWELTGYQVAELASLTTKHKKKGTSVVDLSALVLAKATGVMLLTGDGGLRKAALEEKVQVHGMLWLLDEMVVRKVLGPQDAVQALEKMLNKGARLPARECAEYVRKWNAMSK